MKRLKIHRTTLLGLVFLIQYYDYTYMSVCMLKEFLVLTVISEVKMRLQQSVLAK